LSSSSACSSSPALEQTTRARKAPVFFPQLIAYHAVREIDPGAAGPARDTVRIFERHRCHDETRRAVFDTADLL
jgi:hypothetical protein